MKKIGLGLYILGLEGLGKTSFACHFPNPKVFSIRETGVEDLIMGGQIPPETENTYVRTYASLLEKFSKPGDRCTKILDGASGYESLLREHVIANDFKGSEKNFESFFKGKRERMPGYVDSFINLLIDERRKGNNIVVLGHCKVESEPNPLGEDHLSYKPKLDAGIQSKFTEWAQATLFMTLDIQSTDEDSSKARNSTKRRMYCERMPGHSAKNRLGLPRYIDMGKSSEETFMNFAKALPPLAQECLE